MSLPYRMRTALYQLPQALTTSPRSHPSDGSERVDDGPESPGAQGVIPDRVEMGQARTVMFSLDKAALTGAV